MPSERNRRKDDTWTTDELNRALKGTRDDLDRKKHREDRHRRDDDDKKERRRHRDDVNGDSDDRRRRHKDEDKRSHRDASEDKRRHRKDHSPDDRVNLTEEERERQRRERRDRREKKDPPKEEKKKKAPVIEDDDDYPRRRHRDRDDDKRKHRDDDRERRHKDDDRERRHKDDDRRHRRDEDDNRRRHRDEDDRERRKKETKDRDRHRTDDDDREKRRRERHRDDENEDDRERRREERRERKDKKDKRSDRDGEKRDREKDDKRHRDRNDDKKKQEKEAVSERQKRATKPEPEPEPEEDDEDYNYDDDDFEDYDDDFEEDDEEETKPEGEMDAVLRALDEENNRLMSGSRRSNWSDSTELSDERFKEPEPKAPRGRTFINFVSAQQRALSSKTASKTRKRGEDLLQMLELDIGRYDMFDLPPVREYELYIRSFGRSNTRQAYIQTNEDNIDRDIQTDEIDTKEKWTQEPSDDLLGVGGDGIDPEAGKDSQIISGQGDTVRLAKFVEKAAQAIVMLMDEESGDGGQGRTARQQSSAGFSDGFTQLGTPKFLEGRYVTQACFCPHQPNVLLTVFSCPSERSPDNPVDNYGLACTWNVTDLLYPQRILCCESQPTCCCFSPSKASLAFCGMTDGSVVVWDLREPLSMHRPVKVHDQELILRFPTYNTAGVLDNDNHHSPTTTILPVYSSTVGSASGEDSSDISSGLSFQLASIEQCGVVHLWVVTEIASPDVAGSESDLGLAPGGRIKLLKSSSVTLQSPHVGPRSTGNLQAFEMQLLPTDLNHFFVGTDTGCVVHGVRFGSRAFPRCLTFPIESPVNITTIDFSPFGSPYLLAGCDDGSLHLYHTKTEHPLLSWPVFSERRPVKCVRWSRSRPAVFYVLDAGSTVHVFDLLENDSQPVQRDQFKPGVAVTMCLTSGTAARAPQLLLSMDNGRTEVHTISKQLTEQQTLEVDFIEKYVDKF